MVASGDRLQPRKRRKSAEPSIPPCVSDLQQAIDEFTQAWNQNPKPFIWTATVGQIIEKVDRARVKMEQTKAA